MIKKELLEKIADLNFWQKQQNIGIQRSELKESLTFVDDKDYALLIAGVRRAGKTYLCRQILKEKISQGIKSEQTLYINFEDPILEPYLNVESLMDFYETYRYTLNKENFAYFVLDEVHNVPKWEKWVRIMLEKKEPVKFILTGSSSKFYKEKQAEVLTGRGLTFSIHPLCFSDFLKFKQYTPKRIETSKDISPLLTEYLEFGGFPLIVLEEDTAKKQLYLKELFEDIVIKDIIVKHKLREMDVKKLAVILMNQFASLMSVRKAQNLLFEISQRKISPTSINSYLEYFTQSSLFSLMPIFSYKIKNVLRYPRKVYAVDTGLINALILRFSENIGRLYENLVAQTLLQKYGTDNVFYWQGLGKEIDFVIKDNLKVKQLIQVCFNLKQEKVKERELSALIKASEELNCADLLVITSDYDATETIKNKTIHFTPLWKWLLD